MNFERFFYESLANLQRYLDNRPINLGGSEGEGGGYDGRPAGFLGFLPQSRIAYDTSEASSSGILYQDSPSLVDNLNHIRYRINEISNSASFSGVDIKYQGILFAPHIRTINFDGLVNISDAGNNEVEVMIIPSGSTSANLTVPSGVYNVDLSSQIDGIKNNFVINDNFIPASLEIYYNGIYQHNFTTVSGGFVTDFVPTSGDSLVVNYNKMMDVVATTSFDHQHLYNRDADDAHPQYFKSADALNTFYTKDEINTIVSPVVAFSGLLPAQRGELIVGNSAFGFSKLQSPTSSELVLISDLNEPLGVRWTPYSSTSNFLHQQIILTIVGANLYENGVKPLRIYTQITGLNPHIEEILFYLATAPVYQDLRLAIRRNGNNIITAGYVSLDVGQNFKSITAGFDNTINYDDYFQIEIVQGDVMAADLVVHIRFVSEI